MTEHTCCACCCCLPVGEGASLTVTLNLIQLGEACPPITAVLDFVPDSDNCETTAAIYAGQVTIKCPDLPPTSGCEREVEIGISVQCLVGQGLGGNGQWTIAYTSVFGSNTAFSISDSCDPFEICFPPNFNIATCSSTGTVCVTL